MFISLFNNYFITLKDLSFFKKLLSEMYTIPQRRGLTKGKLLGKGTNGRVYQAISPGGDECAVKRGIALNGYSDLFVGARELDMTVKSCHPCVIQLKKATDGNPFSNSMLSPLMEETTMVVIENNQPVKKIIKKFRDDTIHLVFELAKGGNLYQFRRSRIIWNHIDTQRVMAEILVGLEYIHSMNILHRDLKPENVLMKEESINQEMADLLKMNAFKSVPGTASTSTEKNDPTIIRAKLADFGLSKPYLKYIPQTPHVTTCWYRAPEVCIGIANYDHRMDIWSAGCIMYELFTRQCFNGKLITENDVELVQGIINALPYPITSQMIASMDFTGKFKSIIIPEKPRGLGSFLELINPTTKSYYTDEEIFEKFKIDATLKNFCEILINLLQFDHTRRVTATQALAHPYFDSVRPYINYLRSMRPPAPISYPPAKIYSCVERIWMTNVAMDIYQNRKNYCKWYSDRILFQAIDIFDRLLFKGKNYLRPEIIVTADLGQIFSKKTAQLYFIACIHFAFKYFSALASVPLSEILPPELASLENFKLIGKLEAVLVTQTLDYDIYHDTIYDVLCKHRPPQDNDVFSILNFISAGKHQDKTPDEAYLMWSHKL